LANHTFLLTTNSRTKPPESAADVQILCAGSYMIPVFWYMLFERSSLIDATAEEEDGGTVEYPYLSRPSAEALAAARSRWPAVRQVIGREFKDLFQTWLGFVEENAAEYLQCETVELWMMDADTPGFVREVETCLRAFTELPSLKDSAAWKGLLAQANACNDKGVAPAGNFSFCGFAWELETPWKD